MPRKPQSRWKIRGSIAISKIARRRSGAWWTPNIIGVFVGDFDGRILEANDAFLRIVGFDRQDLAAGRINWRDLTPRDWRDRDTQWLEEHKRTGVRLPIEKEYFRKDGSRVPIVLGSATVEEGGSQSVAFVLDLSERKQAEDRSVRRSEAG